MKGFTRRVAVPIIGAVCGVMIAAAAYGQTAYGQTASYRTFCTINHQARGAAIGAQIGAARGGERGAELGRAIGAARGQRLDEMCRRIAYRRALGVALAPAPTSPPAAAPAAAPARAAPRRHPPARPAPLQTARSGASGYAPVEYRTPSETHERCMVSSEVSFAADGERSPPVTGRVCEGADGRLHGM